VTRPLLLDLFSGAGGCSVGYARAGFDVVGVDKLPHPDYPFQLHVDDALVVLAQLVTAGSYRGHRPDVVHASPPCQHYSRITGVTGKRENHPDLLSPVRELLQAWGGPYIIENVGGAPMPSSVVLCGKAMGLPHLKRHRQFESSAFLLSPGCACDRGPAYGVYGDHGDKNPVRPHPDGIKRWGKARDVEHAQQVMGIDWMTSWDDLADAIPPAYTEFIGAQLLDSLTLEVPA
jgi:DNA (cytosine-5)-methyltransferase 1